MKGWTHKTKLSLNQRKSGVGLTVCLLGGEVWVQSDESQSAVEMKELPSLSRTPPPVLEDTQEHEEPQQVIKRSVRQNSCVFLNLLEVKNVFVEDRIRVSSLLYEPETNIDLVLSLFCLNMEFYLEFLSIWAAVWLFCGGEVLSCSTSTRQMCLCWYSSSAVVMNLTKTSICSNILVFCGLARFTWLFCLFGPNRKTSIRR